MLAPGPDRAWVCATCSRSPYAGWVAELHTERLVMRGWRESDLAPWAAMNADPQVRRYLGPLLTFEQSCAWVLNFQDDLDRHGFGFWAVAVRARGEFIGFT